MSNPSSTLERCTEELDHRRITVKANGRVATFLNAQKARIKKIDVDCWLAASKTAKADYLLSKPGVVDVIIELKGKDIDHAVEQVLATLQTWRALKLNSPRFGGLIVFTRSPQRSAMLDNLKLRLLERNKIWLEMGKSGLKDYEFERFTGARP